MPFCCSDRPPLCSSLITLLCFIVFHLTESSAYTPSNKVTRRAFFSSVPTAALTVAVAEQSILTSFPKDAFAATDDSVNQSIKVTPVAHTFVTASGKVKPLRENDATRFLTNARVVFLFYGDDKSDDLSGQVLTLTKQRKDGQGPGVTPGNIKVALGSDSDGAMFSKAASDNGIVAVKSKLDPQSVAALASSLGGGDVLLVSPQKSGGTAADAKLVAECASAANLEVGGSKSGGVISLLLNGPRAPNAELKVVEAGLEASTILWYDI